ncbi:MAG: carbohydrate-binding family 9-like protein, partial [Cystobacter sp.]
AATPVVLRGSFDGRPVALRTEARLTYDDQHLYVAFDVEDPDVWGTLREKDQPLYTQEVVEVFLDANADGRTYNELQVSPHNVHFDAYFPARRQGMDLSWDSGMTSGVKVRGTLDDASDRDEGWRVEMKILLARLAEVPHLPPRVGDRWRFNLYRLEHPGRKGEEGQSFSPLFVGDFHALPRFGWLVFD